MVEAAAKILIDRHTCSCRSCSEASAATIQRFAPAPEKRERLKRCHELLEGCHAALDPDVDEALDKAIQAELEPCDIAGVCPAPAPEEREPAPDHLRVYVEEDAAEPCEYGCGCPDFNDPHVPGKGPHGRCRACMARNALRLADSAHAPASPTVGDHEFQPQEGAPEFCMVCCMRHPAAAPEPQQDIRRVPVRIAFEFDSVRDGGIWTVEAVVAAGLGSLTGAGETLEEASRYFVGGVRSAIAKLAPAAAPERLGHAHVPSGRFTNPSEGPCMACGQPAAAHAPAASVQPACADCGEVHPPGCDAPEPAARDRLGENARDWLNSYSYPDHQDENMVMLLRAELKRVVRDCLAIARNLGGVDCETAMREHWGLK